MPASSCSTNAYVQLMQPPQWRDISIVVHHRLALPTAGALPTGWIVHFGPSPLCRCSFSRAPPHYTIIIMPGVADAGCDTNKHDRVAARALQSVLHRPTPEFARGPRPNWRPPPRALAARHHQSNSPDHLWL